jgi:isoquinoline 1-oxidoreductase subunit alpha
MAAFQLKVNGQARAVDVLPDTPLLWVIRDALGLTGTKFGCGVAMCGACTVFLNGKPLRSCALPVSALGDGEITTIEGLAGREATAVRSAWIARDVPQCGYCQSGQIMSAVALLKEVKRPTDRDIDHAMNGNICRCATYVRIRAAIKDAARSLGA